MFPAVHLYRISTASYTSHGAAYARVITLKLLEKCNSSFQPVI